MEPVTRRSFLNGLAAGAAAAATLQSPSPAQAAEGPAAEIKPAKSIPFSLGLASYTCRKFKTDEMIAMARRVGFEYVCIKSFHLPLEAKPDEIAATIAKMKAAGLKPYGGGVITMNKAPEVEQAFAYAKAAGMSVIVAKPAPEILPLVNDKVRQTDIKVAIHNHGPGDKVYPTPQSAYEKIKDLDKRIGLCIDVGHTFRIGADPVRDAERFADRLIDLHIKDVSEPTEKAKETEVGRGAIDIVALCRTLVKIGFSGVASFEYEKDENDPLAGLAESVGYVRGVLAAI
ncbi:MAG: sugar phosphate isomerase/epimerase [Candidatus Sumerlaeia bacterium]|nr:sugar phosphate isomerase/epimerase [Candidatus Sumerlaeia bacterium]